MAVGWERSWAPMSLPRLEPSSLLATRVARGLRALVTLGENAVRFQSALLVLPLLLRALRGTACTIGLRARGFDARVELREKELEVAPSHDVDARHHRFLELQLILFPVVEQRLQLPVGIHCELHRLAEPHRRCIRAIAREIHYRLATAPFGGMLRDLIRHDSHASAIARAIAQLRRDFRSPVEIPKLARSVGMSASSFHKHFKAITASSPRG